MTRCCRDSINLKSSVYNQTGQSYLDQVSLHRSMCMHFRRVVQAKCVVDSRNPRFTRAIQRRRRPSSCKLRFSDECPSDDTIDRLAYDSRHHPADIIRVSCRGKSSSPCKERGCSRCRRHWQGRQQPTANDAACPCSLRPWSAKDGSATARFDCPDCLGNAGLQSRARDASRQLCGSKLVVYSPQQSVRSRKSSGARNEEPTSRCRSGDPPDDPWSDEPTTAVAAKATASPETFRELAERKGDEARYAKFVYDITQEIVQNGLYTDRELREVFERHLDKNSGHLNKRKMLYEIYQLKISLNMSDDTEDEEADEAEADLVYAERFARQRVPKPPTPPRTLNEDKVIERLEIFKDAGDSDNAIANNSGASSPNAAAGCNRNVVLVDPNPEFLVTERDVLATLAGEDVSPRQIQRIYRSLCRRSKDVSTCEPVQVGNEFTYSHRLKRADRCSSASSLDKAYAKERLRGILRKESTDFAMKSLSPEMICRNYAYLNYQRTEAHEKCENWRLGTCDCEKQPCAKHLEVPEKEKRCSTPKVPTGNEDSLSRRREAVSIEKMDRNFALRKAPARPSTASSRPRGSVNSTSTKGSRKNGVDAVRKDKIKGPAVSAKREPRKPTESTRSSGESARKERKRSPSPEESPARSGAVSKVVLEEKPEPPKIRVNSEEPEEIEEEIETEVDEREAKSPISEKSDNETEKDDKNLSTVREEAGSDSGSDQSSDDSDDRVSRDDYTEESSDSERDRSARSSPRSVRTADTSQRSSARSSPRPPLSPSPMSTPRKKKTDEVMPRRHSNVLELYQRNADGKQQQQFWQMSEASSDSFSSSSERPGPPTNQPPSPANAATGIAAPPLAARPMRKRTSSGQSGHKVMESWNRKLSEITSDFYKQSESRYCDPRCRSAAMPRSCAENCKFVRTNCRNLSDPTSCLKPRDKSESSTSTGSSV